MKTRSRNLSVIAAALTISIVTVLGCQSKPPSTDTALTATSSAYDRIIKSGTIKCGYVTYPPGCIKDANTGKLSGVFVDALEMAAANMGLKVDWAEEVGWGSMIEGLNADRYDLIGSQVWANSTRAKLADFSVPLFYSGIGVYVRSDDHRFDTDLTTINSPDIKIAMIDGEMSSIIAKQDFERSTVVSHPQLSDNSQILLDLVNGKADVTFVEPYIAVLFLRNNPGTIRNVVPDKPIRVFPNCMMMKKGEIKLKSMLDIALTEQLNTGQVDDLMNQYVPEPGALYPVALPYRSSGKSAEAK